MVEQIFFQSSLPRAGSTLMQNILAQNPDIYATPTSGVLDILLSTRNSYTNNQECKAQDTQLMDKGFKNMCNKALFGFFNGITEKKYVVDKCRGWTGVYPFLQKIYPNPKVIVMIRDLRGIVCSLEKKFRENGHLDIQLQHWGELRGTTVDKRVDMFLSAVPPLNLPVDILYDNIITKVSKKVLYIKYEDLTKNPEPELEKIYKYLEIPSFKHNFTNVEQLTTENDVFYRPFGDHMIRGKIAPMEENYAEILGKHNCRYILEKYNWFYKAFNYSV